MFFGRIIVMVTALAVAAAFTAVASANTPVTYCVGTVPNCVGQNYPIDQLQAALDAAVVRTWEDPTFLLGPGTYSGPFTYTAGGASPIAIQGSGQGLTVLTTTQDTSFALKVTAGGSSISDLTVKAIGGDTTGGLLAGFNAQVSDVTAYGLSTGLSGVAFELYDGASASRITVVTTGDQRGMSLGSGAQVIEATVTGSDAVNSVGIEAWGLTSTVGVSRVHVRGYEQAIANYGRLAVSNTLLDLGDIASATGISTYNSNSSNLTITLDLLRSTIAGRGTNQTGVRFRGRATQSLSAGVTGAVVDLRGTGHLDLYCGNTAGTPTMSMNTSYSAYALSATQTEDTCVGIGATDTLDLDTAANQPTYINAGQGDYRPTHGSSVVDAGQAIMLGLTDLRGYGRNVGTAIDLGAYEYQAAAPTITAVTPLPATVEVGANIQFVVQAADIDGDLAMLEWAFDDGTTATGVSVAKSFATAGIHGATVTATDVTGKTASASTTVTVSTAPVVATPTPDAPTTETPSTTGKSTPVIPGIRWKLTAARVVARFKPVTGARRYRIVVGTKATSCRLRGKGSKRGVVCTLKRPAKHPTLRVQALDANGVLVAETTRQL